MAKVALVSAFGAGHWSAYARRQRNLATYAYALEFHRAALKTGSPLVRSFLLAHALELYFKCYLFLCGLGATELKKGHGHNLVRLFKAAQQRGLGLHVSPAMESGLLILNTALASSKLRYFSLLELLAPVPVPDRRPLFRLAGQLRSSLQLRLRGQPADRRAGA